MIGRSAVLARKWSTCCTRKPASTPDPRFGTPEAGKGTPGSIFLAGGRLVATCCRSPRGVADRRSDCGGYCTDLYFGDPSLWHRAVDRSVEMGRRARLYDAGRDRKEHLPLVRQLGPVVVAGTLHHHVRLDGEVRRRLR